MTDVDELIAEARSSGLCAPEGLIGRLVVELENCQAERDHAKCGNDTLNDLLNRANRYSDQLAAELAECRERIRRVEALCAEWSDNGEVGVELVRKALTAPALDEGGE